MNFLAIDYGSKRIGLAFGDDLGVAVPVDAIKVKNKKETLAQLKATIDARQIDEVVIGYPYNMNGTIGFKAKEVDTFITDLEKITDKPIFRVDERLSTHQVVSDLKEMGRKTKTDKRTRKSGDIDSSAAALILQDYLNQKLGLF